MSDGELRRNKATTGITARAHNAMVIPTHRQPWLSASRVRSGRNTNCPLADAAVRAPVTRPRRATNQRDATVDANTVAMHPEPVPTTAPHRRYKCHGADICVVASAPRLMTESAPMVMRRNPYFSWSAAANGPMSPNNNTLILTAVPTMLRLQPNSSRNGSMRIAGVERNPAAPSSVINATTKITHA